MSTHVDLDIADFVSGRLTEARRKEIEEHLRKCDPCAAEATWASEFREQALRQGLRHLEPMRVVELASRPEVADEAEREHLASCDSCRGEVDWAEGSAPVDAESEGDEPPSAPSANRPVRARPLRWAWLAAAALIVLALWVLPRGTRFDPSRFAIVEPLPVRTSRSIPESGSFEESRLLGLEAYASGNYESAAAQFGRALSIADGEAEVLLYLGSAELLERDLESAVLHLSDAKEFAVDGPVHDEAAWQLANTFLLLGRLDEAERILETLAAGEGRRHEDSSNVLVAIDAARGR